MPATVPHETKTARETQVEEELRQISELNQSIRDVTGFGDDTSSEAFVPSGFHQSVHDEEHEPSPGAMNTPQQASVDSGKLNGHGQNPERSRLIGEASGDIPPPETTQRGQGPSPEGHVQALVSQMDAESKKNGENSPIGELGDMIKHVGSETRAESREQVTICTSIVAATFLSPAKSTEISSPNQTLRRKDDETSDSEVQGNFDRRKEKFKKRQLNKFHAPVKQGLGRSLTHPLKLFASSQSQQDRDSTNRSGEDTISAGEHHGSQGGWVMKGKMFRTCLAALLIMAQLQHRSGKKDTRFLSKTSINFLVFSNILLTVFFAVFDLSTAIIFALAWPHDNYLCKVVDDDDEFSSKNNTRRVAACQGMTVDGLHWGFFCLLVIVPIVDTTKLVSITYFSGTYMYHFLLIEVAIITHIEVLRYRTRFPDGSKVGFRYWTKPNIGDGISLESRLTETVWLIISVISLSLSATLCYPNRIQMKRLIHELHKLSHFLRALHSLHKCYTLRKKAKKNLQIAVSQNKRRFVSPIHSIDIDLSYICDRLLAMSIPCHASVMHRNEIKEVSRFFRTWHYGHFKIYNLCEAHEENGSGNYDTGFFYHQVQKVPMKDKHAPPLQVIIHFCEDASAWLEEDPLNVLAVHCKGGTGRTGTMCASLMLFTRRFRTAQASLRAFHNRRMHVKEESPSSTKALLSSPSQMRYVSYVETCVKKGIDFLGGTQKLISNVKMECIPHWLTKGQTMNVQVECRDRVVFDYAKMTGAMDTSRSEGQSREFQFEPVAVQGDVTVRIFVLVNGSVRKGIKPLGRMQINQGPGSQGVSMMELCHVQFHTAFCSVSEDTVYDRGEIDGINDLSHEQMPPDFKLIVRVRDVEEDPAAIFRKLQTRFSQTSHFIWLATMLPVLASRVSPETMVFEEGQVMFHAEHRPTVRKVYYIVSGLAKRYLPGTDSTKSVINNSALYGECLGAGEFFGIGAFVLGHGLDPHRTMLRAWSRKVVVRIFTVPGPVDDVIQQVMFNGTTPHESAGVWEALARQVNFHRKAEDAANSHVYSPFVDGFIRRPRLTMVCHFEQQTKRVLVNACQKAMGEKILHHLCGGLTNPDFLYAGAGTLTWAAIPGNTHDDHHIHGTLVITSEIAVFSVVEGDTVEEVIQLPLDAVQRIVTRTNWLSLTLKDEAATLMSEHASRLASQPLSSPINYSSKAVRRFTRATSGMIPGLGGLHREGSIKAVPSAERGSGHGAGHGLGGRVASMARVVSTVGRLFRRESKGEHADQNQARLGRTGTVEVESSAPKRSNIKGHVLHLRPEEPCLLSWLRDTVEARSREITHHKSATVLNVCFDSKGKARPEYLGFGYFLPGEESGAEESKIGPGVGMREGDGHHSAGVGLRSSFRGSSSRPPPAPIRTDIPAAEETSWHAPPPPTPATPALAGGAIFQDGQRFDSGFVRQPSAMPGTRFPERSEPSIPGAPPATPAADGLINRMGSRIASGFVRQPSAMPGTRRGSSSEQSPFGSIPGPPPVTPAADGLITRKGSRFDSGVARQPSAFPSFPAVSSASPLETADAPAPHSPRMDLSPLPNPSSQAMPSSLDMHEEPPGASPNTKPQDASPKVGAMAKGASPKVRSRGLSPAIGSVGASPKVGALGTSPPLVGPLGRSPAAGPHHKAEAHAASKHQDPPLAVTPPRSTGGLLSLDPSNTDWNQVLSDMWTASIRRQYGSGDLIIEVGGTHGCLYHILSGQAQAVDAKNNKLLTLQAGEILGEMSFLDVGTMGARSNVVADGPVECQMLSQEALRTLMHFHPVLGARICRGITIVSFLRYYCQQNSTAKLRPTSTALTTPGAEWMVS